MNKKVYETLEYTKIVEQLEKRAASALGKEACRQLLPMRKLAEVQFAQAETEEGAKVIRLKGAPPGLAVQDIRSHLKRSEIGGMLNPTELSEIKHVLQTTKQMIRFFDGMEEAGIELPILYDYKSELYFALELEKEISSAIGDDAEVLDSASQELKHLRYRIRTDEAKIREKLSNIIGSQNTSKMLSDALITIRNDRFVIPVKQEYRHHFGGVVHDQSASGQTLFIEPQSIMQASNDLQNVKLKEVVEIERILMKLTGLVAENAAALAINNNLLGKIDFAFAKALFGKKMNATRPLMNDKGIIKLIKARHPMIPAETAVPNDIHIGEDYSTLVITGPNTGGKTVALKTVGICTLMAMSGLQIPAQEGSSLAVFTNVFADIGDEQSIEQSLSTFSSHMTNIVEILKTLDDRSLVLYDELGAGTDPGEGAALAISILDESKSRGARVMATTHYPELKAYGFNTEDVMNASVEFDVETLSPTYKLLIGIPGKSNAFDISKKLGLEIRIIDSARKMIGTDTQSVENMIVQLEKSRNQAEKNLAEAHKFLEEAAKIKENLEKETLVQLEKKENIEERAHKEAADVVNKARREADEIIKELRQIKKLGVEGIKEHELIEKRKQLEAAKPTQVVKRAVSKKKVIFYNGDDVKVISLKKQGQLIKKDKNESWVVQVGIMKITVSENDLEKIHIAPKVPVRQVSTPKRDNARYELDLRGERYDEAIHKVGKFIDEALLAGFGSVAIIHGHGTGALRQGVREYLKNHRSVKSIRFGGQGEGGLGCTIAEL